MWHRLIRTMGVLVVTLALTLTVWALLSWPLPLHIAATIPVGHQKTPHPAICALAPTPALHELYQWWLAGDMLAGDTPWLRNVHQFAGRSSGVPVHPSGVFLFAPIFRLAENIGGRAFAFNATFLLAFWFATLWTWLLVRRYSPNAITAGLAVLVALAIPFPWIALLSGQRAVTAVAWIPLALLGVDRIVRRQWITGGLLAVIAASCAVWTTEGSGLALAKAAIPSIGGLVGLGLLRLLASRFPGRRSQAACGAIILAVLGAEALAIRPALMRVPRSHAAYDSITINPGADGHEPRALAIPLWPGDAPDTLLPLYYASLYDIALVNGYSLPPPAGYRESVYEPLSSVNSGLLSEDQVDQLVSDGVGTLILHETLFSEAVSPFPVGLTLERLLNHPRLSCRSHEGSVWIFEIAGTRGGSKPIQSIVTTLFPARSLEVENLPALGDATRIEADNAGRGQAVRLSPAAPAVTIPLAAELIDRPLDGFVRVRGRGAFTVHVRAAGETSYPFEFLLDTPDWIWLRIPLEPGPAPVDLQLTCATHPIEVDTCLLADRLWTPPEPAATLELRPGDFFHRGSITADLSGVALRPEETPAGPAFRGPRLPLPAGAYRVQLQFDSPAKSETRLGTWRVRWEGNDSVFEVPVLAGHPAELEFAESATLPWLVELDYAGTGRMTVLGVVLTRLR